MQEASGTLLIYVEGIPCVASGVALPYLIRRTFGSTLCAWWPFASIEEGLDPVVVRHLTSLPVEYDAKHCVTVLRRPANRPDAQLLESATVV